MATKRRIEIRYESSSRLAVVKRGGVRAWCQPCGEMVELIDAAAAAALRGCTQRTIFALAADGLLHVSDAPGGMLLVCLSSLLAVEKP